MTTDFTQLSLHPQLVQAVTERGYQTPTPIQSALIPVMLTGKDVIGQAQTGTGKTAAFALPLLNNLEPGQSYVQALVVVPTRELALQVAEAVGEYGQFSSVRVLAVYGGAPYRPQINELRRGVDIVVGTPGRLIDLMNKEILDLRRVRTVVLDEADEMLNMGFIEDIESILAATPFTRQTALFSATMPAEIRRLAEKYMNDPQSITIRREQMTVATVDQRYYLVNDSDKLAALTRLFEVEDITSALIFVRTRNETGELANALTLRGFPAEALNGDMNQESRERTMTRFRQNLITVLVATDVAARGLDIDDISHVINVGLPEDAESYVHRIGRTGRAGKTGTAITLLTPQERRRLGYIEHFTRCKIKRGTLPSETDIIAYREKQLMDKVGMWLRRGRCLHERELLEALVAEGHDPLAVAAAALKVARADEKQRPIAAITPVVEPLPVERTRERAGASRGGPGRPQPRAWNEAASHEPGMVRLSLNLGRKHGIGPSDIVGAIARHAEIPGSAIGKIHIQEKSSLVDVPEALAERVMAKASEVRIRRMAIAMQRA